MNVAEPFLKRRSDYVYSSPAEDSEMWFTPSDGDPTFYSNAPGARTHSERFFVGYDTPNFHNRVRKGELMPFTPWRQFVSEGYTSGVLDTVYDAGGGESVHWYMTNGYAPRTDWILTEPDLAALAPEIIDLLRYTQSAAARIYSSGHDSLTFLVELVQIKSLFMNAAKTLSQLRIPSNWKDLSNEWLSTRYGWRVLLYDIDVLSQAIASLYGPRRTRHSEKTGITYRSESSNVTEQEFTHFWMDHLIQDKIEVSLRGSVVADIDIPPFQFNPFVTAWEIVPLSFVIDWLIGVGKSIAALSFMAFETNYAASYGYQIKITRTTLSSISTPKSGFISGTREQQGLSQATLEIRTPCNVPLSPQLKLNLNPMKILDLLGLIIQRL